MTDFIPFFFFKVSLVSKDSSMLDGLENASVEMEEAKVCFAFSETRGNWKTDNREAYNNMIYVIMCSTVLCHIIEIYLQARLNEIITSGVKTVQSNGISPWMADGSGLPSNASELLPKLVTAFNLFVYIMYRSSILHLVE